MIHNKQKLHAIGNYLRERFGYEWHFVNALSSNPDTIMIDGVDVMIKFDRDDNLIASCIIGDNTIARRFQTPMQVIDYIITRKFEVR